jgi:hypothetical protein
MSIVTRGLGDPGSLVTRGLGGTSVLDILGPGVVINVAEAAVLDLGVIEDLVTAIEQALAPVVQEFITEEGLEIGVSSAATLSMSLASDAAISMSLSEESVQVQSAESSTVTTSPSESSGLVITPAESGSDTEASESAPTTISTDESNAGE